MSQFPNGIHPEELRLHALMIASNHDLPKPEDTLKAAQMFEGFLKGVETFAGIEKPSRLRVVPKA
jgi:hypothetical protein